MLMISIGVVLAVKFVTKTNHIYTKVIHKEQLMRVFLRSPEKKGESLTHQRHMRKAYQVANFQIHYSYLNEISPYMSSLTRVSEKEA